MKLYELLKDGIIILIAIGIILSMFIFHYAITKMTDNRDITVSQTLTGKAIVIENKFEPKNKVVIEDPPPSLPAEENQFTTDNLRCWGKHGVRSDDVVVIGDLLDKTRCDAQVAQPKKIDVKRVNNCLHINVDDKVITVLCIDDKQPEVAIDIPTGFGVAQPVMIKKSYNSSILFLLFLLGIIIIWGRLEIRSIRKRLRRKNTFDEGDIIEVKYVRPSPVYNDKELDSQSLADIEKSHKKLIEEHSEQQANALEKVRLKAEEVAEYTKRFNETAEKANEALKKENIVEAKKLYLTLFPLYTRLYNTLDESSKAELQAVTKYIHDQINIATKSIKIRELIDKAYSETEFHKIERTQPRTQYTQYSSASLREMNKLRDLIEQNKLEEAKAVFGGGIVHDIRKLRGELVKTINSINETLAKSRTEPAKEAKKELKELKKLVKS